MRSAKKFSKGATRHRYADRYADRYAEALRALQLRIRCSSAKSEKPGSRSGAVRSFPERSGALVRGLIARAPFRPGPPVRTGLSGPVEAPPLSDSRGRA